MHGERGVSSRGKQCQNQRAHMEQPQLPPLQHRICSTHNMARNPTDTSDKPARGRCRGQVHPLRHQFQEQQVLYCSRCKAGYEAAQAAVSRAVTNVF